MPCYRPVQAVGEAIDGQESQTQQVGLVHHRQHGQQADAKAAQAHRIRPDAARHQPFPRPVERRVDVTPQPGVEHQRSQNAADSGGVSLTRGRCWRGPKVTTRSGAAASASGSAVAVSTAVVSRRFIRRADRTPNGMLHR